MKKLLTILCLFVCMVMYGQVTATSDEIAQDLDLKAVGTLFGESSSVEDFEKRLNDNTLAISNLDLNGDGEVDYLRCVESANGNAHYVVIQAVLAQNVYQDVATVYTEKASDGTINTQIVGNEYIYGTNYIIQPVYVYRPRIYTWYWSYDWYVWESPYYWGYYPGWYIHHHCCHRAAYWEHIHGFHRDHHNSFSRPSRPAPDMNMDCGKHRNDYADKNPGRSYNDRHPQTTTGRTQGGPQARPQEGGSLVRRPSNPTVSTHTGQPMQQRSSVQTTRPSSTMRTPMNQSVAPSRSSSSGPSRSSVSHSSSSPSRSSMSGPSRSSSPSRSSFSGSRSSSSHSSGPSRSSSSSHSSSSRSSSSHSSSSSRSGGSSHSGGGRR